MAFTGNYVCTSFKKELLDGTHDFPNDTWKIALYDNNASFTAATTAYTTDNEVSGTGYSAGGGTLTVVAPTSSGTTAYVDFSDYTFSTVTVTARGAMIYNSSKANRAAVILDFGRNITKTAADLVITFPTADATNAIIRIE
jgi:hypothetical protein